MDKSTKDKRTILVLVVSIWVLLIIAVASIYIAVSHNIPAKLGNAENSKVSELLNASDRERLQKALVATVRGKGDEHPGDFTFVIRESTIEKSINANNTEIANFIVDIDKFKLSYNIEMAISPKEAVDEDVFVTCPELKLMKYKDSFCYGDLETSTISVAFGGRLPYDGEINGASYRAYSGLDEENRPVIAFYSRSCIDDVERKIFEDFKEQFSDIEFDLDKIPTDFSEVTCSHGE